LVGEAGEPQFLTDVESPSLDNLCPFAFGIRWQNYGADFAKAGFVRDAFGIVHLQGLVASGVYGCAVFQLPPGYRPGARQIFATVAGNTLGRVDIVGTNTSLAGLIVPKEIGNNAFVSLSGITFRCAPSGSNGCP